MSSYQVLARKWRPHQFSEVVGQSHVVQALINGLDNGRLHHAFLFTGTRGVGKTTLARILAKSLNCEQGIGSTPCGTCAICREVDEGRFIDLIEVDAASRTKVEDTRDLLENVQYAPVRGRYKVYLIDEVHMLSGHSFNALLKTLEEPPEHVKFLLATTDPQKLPMTILSRCLRFHLRRLTVEEIAGQLQHLLEQEQIPFEKEALPLIARGGDGSMRDALSLMDQAIAFCNKHIQMQKISEMLGLLDDRHAWHLLEAISAGDATALFSALQQIEVQNVDYYQLLGALIEVLHKLAVWQILPEQPLALDTSLWQPLRDRILAADLQLFYQIALHGRRDMPLALDSRSGFEMCMLRMLHFRPQEGRAAVARLTPTAAPAFTERAQTLDSPAATIPVDTPALVNEPAPVSSQHPTISEQEMIGTPAIAEQDQPEIVQKNTKTTPNIGADEIPESPPGKTLEIAESQIPEDAPMPYKMDDLPPPWQQEAAESLPLAAPETAVVTEATAVEAPADPVDWLELVPQLHMAGLPLALAENAVLNEVCDHHWQLTVEYAARSANTPRAREALIQALNQYYRRDDIQVSVRVLDEMIQAKTWARAEESERQQLLLTAQESIAQDPLVQMIQQRFDARLDSHSIIPNSV